MSESMVRLEGIDRTFHPDGEPDVPVLRGVNLEVGAGETVAIVGPSGCGKSTLLNVIGGLDRADAGSVEIGGRDLTGMNDRKLAELRNRTIGFVFQLHHLLPQCTVIENILVPTMARTDHPDADKMRTRAQTLLERIDLAHRREAFPATLSGGERQRVAVARALINSPALLLADEPTGALDATSADSLADLLMALNQEEGTTLILVTHSKSLAGRMSRSMQLLNGHLEPLSGGEP